MIHKIKHHSKRIASSIINRIKKGFTLIELLIVVAVLGILATAVLVAINPGKRTAQARDAQRKQGINAIANALIGYQTVIGNYPGERVCDSSIGSSNLACNDVGFTPSGDWVTTDLFYRNLVTDQAFLKGVPKDPINDSTDKIYYYRYEPRGPGEAPCSGTGITCKYWIGVRLEDVPSGEMGRRVFRCTDEFTPPGCAEVVYTNASGASSFDTQTK